MPNWFESNPTRSVIAYTLLIAGATWAVSTFVLHDNRLNLAQSELAAQKALTDQYKSKVELTQRDLEAVRSENAEYRTWLGRTQDAIPLIVPRISELKEKVSTLENNLAQARATEPPQKEPPKEYYATTGRAFIHDETGLILTVKGTTPDPTATVAVQFPGRDTTEEVKIDPGKKWKFRSGDMNYVLTVTEVSFLGSSIRFRITRE